MASTTELLTALGLAEDSELITALDGAELDEAASQKLLDAATELRSKAEKPAPKPEVKTLEQQASEAGMVILDSTQVADLTRKATAGETALKQLHAQRFETAFTLALEDKAGARVTPGEKDSLKHFYELDADATIAMIEAREPVVPGRPHGAPTIDLDAAEVEPAELAAHGIHPDSHGLDAAIKKHLLDHKLPQSSYVKVLDEYIRGEVVL